MCPPISRLHKPFYAGRHQYAPTHIYRLAWMATDFDVSSERPNGAASPSQLSPPTQASLVSLTPSRMPHCQSLPPAAAVDSAAALRRCKPCQRRITPAPACVPTCALCTLHAPACPHFSTCVAFFYHLVFPIVLPPFFFTCPAAAHAAFPPPARLPPLPLLTPPSDLPAQPPAHMSLGNIFALRRVFRCLRRVANQLRLCTHVI